VQLIIADTGPISYLVLIGNIDLLPVLFGKVILPSAVEAKLSDPDAPPSVRNWIAGSTKSLLRQPPTTSRTGHFRCSSTELLTASQSSYTPS
jgi:hypothetical protein